MKSSRYSVKAIGFVVAVGLAVLPGCGKKMPDEGGRGRQAEEADEGEDMRIAVDLRRERIEPADLAPGEEFIAFAGLGGLPNITGAKVQGDPPRLYRIGGKVVVRLPANFAIDNGRLMPEEPLVWELWSNKKWDVAPKTDTYVSPLAMSGAQEYPCPTCESNTYIQVLHRLHGVIGTGNWIRLPLPDMGAP